MSTAMTPPSSPPRMALPTDWTLADLQEHLGGVPLERIRIYPFPGTATEQDALDLADREGRACELIDGVLVEKVKASWESVLACFLIQWMNNFLVQHPLGVVLGETGALRILPTQMRIPDVSFIRWERFPSRTLPRDRVFRVVPDLAVEILSEGNTAGEMQKKLEEYFAAGVELVWYIAPESRTATVHTAPGSSVELDESGVLDGGHVLPGFQVRLADLLDRVPREDQ